MKTTLNYKFKRKSENHLDWLINIIKSEKYYLIEANIVISNQRYQRLNILIPINYLINFKQPF